MVPLFKLSEIIHQLFATQTLKQHSQTVQRGKTRQDSVGWTDRTDLKTRRQTDRPTSAHFQRDEPSDLLLVFTEDAGRVFKPHVGK